MHVIGVSSSYSFQVRSADGSPLRVERATEALPVAPEEAELRREEIERNMRASFPGWRWNGQPIPSTKPAFTHFIVGDDGRIWVRVHTAGERRRETADGGEERVVYAETTRFDVFESDGRFLGTVDSRVDLETYPLPVARGDSIWGIVRDGLGVPTVRRFVVTRVDSVAQIDEVDDGRGG
jgi:hypothetical protein